MGLSRRDALKAGVFASAAVLLPVGTAVRAKGTLENRMPASRLPRPFTVPFAVPPVAVPVRSDAAADYYRIRMRAVSAEILPGFRTTVYGYDGSVPGPTFKVRQGRPIVVRQINELPARHATLRYEPYTSVHLHGSASLPQFDGYASDITRPGQYKDYHYPNFQNARTLWYHDHGVHHTAENVYQGLAGQYHLSDPKEQALGLPTGEFDVPLTIGDAMFDTAGQLLFSLDDSHGMFGDVILVNGRPWPAMKVKRRRYRFRFLNGSISRSYSLSLSTGDPFTFIATDGGLMPTPQLSRDFRFASGERYEVVIDFAKYPSGTRIVLKNTSPRKNTDYDGIENVMAFDVVGDPFDRTNNAVPAQLDPGSPVMALSVAQSVRTRNMRLQRGGGLWTINKRTWADVEASEFRLLEAEPRSGDVEIWELENKSGGWFHPMHIHLVDFKLLDRNGKPRAPYEAGPKDVAYVGENEKVRVLARFTGAGKYMFHCHNVIHEDHDMMVQFRVVPPPGGREFDPFSAPAVSLPERTPL